MKTEKQQAIAAEAIAKRWEAVGLPVKNDFTESRCVAELFKMYQELTTK